MRTLTIDNKLKTLAIAMFAGFGTINADNTLSADKLFISAGETKTVTINLSNDEDIKGVGMDIYLPEGLSFVHAEESDPEIGVQDMVYSITDRVEDCWLEKLGQNIEKGTEFGVFAIAGTIKAGTGAIATFDVQASKDFVADAAIIRYENTASIKPFTSRVINGKYQVTLSMDEILIKKGGETKSNIYLNNPAEELWGCGINITLPEGLDITEAVKTERTSNKDLIFKHLKEDSHEVYIDFSSMNNLTFPGKDGAIVTLTFKATEELEEGAQVKLYNFIGNTWDSEFPYESEDVVSTVKINNATGITGVEDADETGAKAIYNVNGIRTDRMTKGINIVRKADGKVIKVIKK